MADRELVNSFQATVANTPQIALIASTVAAGTLITGVSLANDTSVVATYKAYIGPTTPTPTLPQVPTRVINSKRTDIPPELTGKSIKPGEALWLETSVALSIALTVTGRDLNGT